MSEVKEPYRVTASLEGDLLAEFLKLRKKMTLEALEKNRKLPTDNDVVLALIKTGIIKEVEEVPEETVVEEPAEEEVAEEIVEEEAVEKREKEESLLVFPTCPKCGASGPTYDAEKNTYQCGQCGHVWPRPEEEKTYLIRDETLVEVEGRLEAPLEAPEEVVEEEMPVEEAGQPSR